MSDDQRNNSSVDVRNDSLDVLEPQGKEAAAMGNLDQSAAGFEPVHDAGEYRHEQSDLSHAQEDQQAEPELQSEEELRALDVAAEAGEGGFDRDESGLELLHDSEAGLADDGSQTRLPDGEGIVVWDDETDPTIKDLLRKTEAAWRAQAAPQA